MAPSNWMRNRRDISPVELIQARDTTKNQVSRPPSCCHLSGKELRTEGNRWFGLWSHALEHNQDDPQCLVSEVLQLGCILFPALRPPGDHGVCLSHPLLIPLDSEWRRGGEGPLTQGLHVPVVCLTKVLGVHLFFVHQFSEVNDHGVSFHEVRIMLWINASATSGEWPRMVAHSSFGMSLHFLPTRP